MSKKRVHDLRQHVNPKKERAATAPYNFVPLPETVVTVLSSESLGECKDDKERERLIDERLPNHNLYDSNRHTGYFDVELTTKSPIYVRCGLSMKKVTKDGMTEFEQAEAEKDNKVSLRSFRDSMKNKPDFFYTDGISMQPVIPGSSLRGMLRNLLEIVSYSKMKWVTTNPKIYYRAVAAEGGDALGDIYKKKMRKVEAGYLIKRDERWYVQPAKRPDRDEALEGQSYLRVKESEIVNGKVPGFLHFNHEKYVPQYHPVTFDAEIRDEKYVVITNIGSEDSKYKYRGVLVCSGNMRETRDEETPPSNRKKYALVLDADNKQYPIKISQQAIDDYCESLTPFQKELPFNEKVGCLKEGNPIFYLKGQKEVIYFGHTPNFRLPAVFEANENKGFPKANTPLDFLPAELRGANEIDYAEAIFGYARTREELDDLKRQGLHSVQGPKEQAYASRVFITDTVVTESPNGLWLSEEAITPKILASPKATAFQHYLVQTEPNPIKFGKKKDGSPKYELRLRHYASPTPDETVIRGHKLYWHQGETDILSLNEIRQRIEEEKETLKKILEDEEKAILEGKKKPDTQHTQFKPLSPNVTFRFHVYFENLSDEELGALCWTLHPLGEEEKKYCHSLGMGKPFGMGAVKLNATLHLSKREDRYGSLFAGNNWQTGELPLERLSARTVLESRAKTFEKRVLNAVGLDEGKRLCEVPRIEQLLLMMQWPGPNPHEVKYMDLERFKERPVLPDPTWFKEGMSDVAPPSSINSAEIKQEEEKTTNIVQPEDKHQAIRKKKHDSVTLPPKIQNGSKPIKQSESFHPSAEKLLDILKSPKKTGQIEKREVIVSEEVVVLLKDAQSNGRAMVRTEQGAEFICGSIPPYPRRVKDSKILARVTRKEGKAISAVYVKDA